MSVCPGQKCFVANDLWKRNNWLHQMIEITTLRQDVAKNKHTSPVKPAKRGQGSSQQLCFFILMTKFHRQACFALNPKARRECTMQCRSFLNESDISLIRKIHLEFSGRVQALKFCKRHFDRKGYYIIFLGQQYNLITWTYHWTAVCSGSFRQQSDWMQLKFLE